MARQKKDWAMTDRIKEMALTNWSIIVRIHHRCHLGKKGKG